MLKMLAEVFFSSFFSSYPLMQFALRDTYAHCRAKRSLQNDGWMAKTKFIEEKKFSSFALSIKLLFACFHLVWINFNCNLSFYFSTSSSSLVYFDERWHSVCCVVVFVRIFFNDFWVFLMIESINWTINLCVMCDNWLNVVEGNLNF